jgi:hypothetical protein
LSIGFCRWKSYPYICFPFNFKRKISCLESFRSCRANSFSFGYRNDFQPWMEVNYEFKRHPTPPSLQIHVHFKNICVLNLKQTRSIRFKTKAHIICTCFLPREFRCDYFLGICVWQLKLRIILIKVLKLRLLSYTSNSPLERGCVISKYKLNSPHTFSISFKICSSLNLNSNPQFVHSIFLYLFS